MYTAEIRIPVSFDADDDATARLRLEHIANVLTDVSIPHDGEVFDAPGLWLADNPPYEQQRILMDPAQLRLFGDEPDMIAGDPDDCDSCRELRDDRLATYRAYMPDRSLAFVTSDGYLLNPDGLGWTDGDLEFESDDSGHPVDVWGKRLSGHFEPLTAPDDTASSAATDVPACHGPTWHDGSCTHRQAGDDCVSRHGTRPTHLWNYTAAPGIAECSRCGIRVPAVAPRTN